MQRITDHPTSNKHEQHIVSGMALKAYDALQAAARMPRLVENSTEILRKDIEAILALFGAGQYWNYLGLLGSLADGDKEISLDLYMQIVNGARVAAGAPEA